MSASIDAAIAPRKSVFVFVLPSPLEKPLGPFDVAYRGAHLPQDDLIYDYPAASRVAWNVSAGSSRSSFQMIRIGRSLE